MTLNPPPGMPRITPHIYSEDAQRALDWVTGTLGFRERKEMRVTGPDGVILHAEAEYGDGVVAFGHPGPGFQSAKRQGGAKGLLYIYVLDDLDAHYERARDAGADIVMEPEDTFYGDRRYSIVDPEGNEWTLAQHVRDVSPEEWA